MSVPTTLDQVEETLADLRASMSAKFSLEEVRSLSLDMGIDHEDLPATKRAAVRELVLAVSRQHKLEGLVERCRELRPDSTWPNISNEEASLIARRSELAQRLSPSESKEREQQRILLTKVKNWWINAVLEKSVTEEELIEVGQKPYFEAIDHPWHEVLGTAIYDALSLTSQKDILTTFRESDCALLILGEPGTGKTTTMLRLARELIHTAEQEPDQPIPIVLNLAPWAEENPPLNDWVVGELTRRYQIPKEMGRRWLEDRRLVG